MPRALRSLGHSSLSLSESSPPPSSSELLDSGSVCSLRPLGVHEPEQGSPCGRHSRRLSSSFLALFPGSVNAVTCTHMHTYAHTCVHTDTCTHTCVHTGTRTHLCAHTRTYTCTHTHTHTYTHTCGCTAEPFLHFCLWPRSHSKSPAESSGASKEPLIRSPRHVQMMGPAPREVPLLGPPEPLSPLRKAPSLPLPFPKSIPTSP